MDGGRCKLVGGRWSVVGGKWSVVGGMVDGRWIYTTPAIANSYPTFPITMFDQQWLICAVFKQLWNPLPSETKLLTLNIYAVTRLLQSWTLIN